jgi:uncharacterized protein DUF6763
MSINFDPVVGNWYEDLDNGQRFEVIEIDEDREIIEIQYPNGDMEEIDLSEWYDLDLELVEGSGWTRSRQGMEDDLEYSRSGVEEEGRSRSRSTKIKRSWDEEDDEEEDNDEWDERYSERWDKDD